MVKWLINASLHTPVTQWMTCVCVCVALTKAINVNHSPVTPSLTLQGDILNTPTFPSPNPQPPTLCPMTNLDTLVLYIFMYFF